MLCFAPSNFRAIYTKRWSRTATTQRSSKYLPVTTLISITRIPAVPGIATIARREIPRRRGPVILPSVDVRVGWVVAAVGVVIAATARWRVVVHGKSPWGGPISPSTVIVVVSSITVAVAIVIAPRAIPAIARRPPPVVVVKSRRVRPAHWRSGTGTVPRWWIRLGLSQM